MAKTVAIGKQAFDEVIENDCFYVDKTGFIKEWWENKDDVTLITRPRRFGKTLTMSMVEQFFSVKYAGRADLFQGLQIWDEEKYQKLQGTYPVISLSFAGIKDNCYLGARQKICQIIANLYAGYNFVFSSERLTDNDKFFIRKVSADMDDMTAAMALHQLSLSLYNYYGKKIIILLDEYDTPMQEAYLNGYWQELVPFIRSFFNFTFKTNPYIERAIMTGITRVSKESIFSDLNNLEVITTTSKKYEAFFGFTEDEVSQALELYGLSDQKEEVRRWYDGFKFGNCDSIYNPWSMLNFLSKRKFAPYWVNTSSNRLVAELIRHGNQEIQTDFEILMQGNAIETNIDEEIVFDQLDDSQEAVWSFLLASGYLKIVSIDDSAVKRSFLGKVKYELALTNGEIQIMCASLVRGWFSAVSGNYNRFVKALLTNNVQEMNAAIYKISDKTFSFFDVGGGNQPECFYHGFVLGLIAQLGDRYRIMSNRESGDGRYDVMLEPFSKRDPAMILEFKVADPSGKKDGKDADLQNAVQTALEQIQERKYDAELLAREIGRDRIRIYGFAFRGKEVRIGGGPILDYSRS